MFIQWVDLFEQSLLSQVVDGLDDLIRGGFREQLERLSQQLRKGLQVGVLSRTFSAEVVSAVGNWLQHPIARAVTEENVPACSACISQLVSVVTTHESKLSKVILQHLTICRHLIQMSCEQLCMLENDSHFFC